VCVVDVLLRDGVLGHERLETSERALGVVQSRQRATIHGVILDLIQLVENLALPDDAAFNEWAVENDAVDTRANFDSAERLDLANELVWLGDACRYYSNDADLSGWRREWLWLCTVAGGRRCYE
jgi:hypothetical protein